MAPSQNAPCACGSGRKFKHCCGKKAQSFTPPGFDVASVLKQAFAFHQGGQLQQAEAGYRRVLEVQPSHPDALHLLGQIAESAGRLEIARDLIGRASGAKPDEVLYRLSLARVLLALKQPVDAEVQARKALQLRPGNHEARYVLANVFLLQARLPEAIKEYERVLAIEPRHAGALNNLGSALNDAGRLAESLVRLYKFLEVQPGSVEGLCNVGNALRRMGRFGEAIEYYERALLLRPSHEARFSLSLCLLGLGRLDRAWAEYGERFRKENDPVPLRPFPYPWWQGEALAGKTLLVWGEQGVGDEILFSEVLGDAIRGGARVLVECEPRLVSLFARSFPEAEVFGKTERPDTRLQQAGVDYQIPMGSLARWYRSTVERFPRQEGCLKPDPQRSAHWKDWLDTLGPGPKVGIGWRSMLRRLDRDSYYTELSQWDEILKTPGVVFVNLQYGDCREELEQARRLFGVEIHQASGLNLKDQLDDAAALTRALDLVIAPNTSVFAMAGAVGVPTWLLNLDSDWTMLGTDFIPWFPSVKVYLKAWDAPWAPLLQGVAGNLRELAEGRPVSDWKMPGAELAGEAITPAPVLDVEQALAQGYQHHQGGRPVQAEFLYWRVLAQQPGNPDALNLLGLLSMQSGRNDLAVELLSRATAARPALPAYHSNLGNALRAQGRLAEAAASYERALQLDPAYAKAHNNLGIVLKQLERVEDAEKSFRQAVEVDPASAEAWANLGNTLLDQGRPDEAIPLLERALELNPGLAEANSSMGAALYFMPGGLEPALKYHELAIAQMPGYFMARWRMAPTLLASGNLERGWAEYALRFKAREGYRCPYPQAWWRGEPLAGKRLLIWGEQGVGDEILFASLVGDALAAGAQVMLACEPRLATLFARSFPRVRVFPHAVPLQPELMDGAIDYHVPAGDIARWRRHTVDSFPRHEGYLVPAAESIRYWKDWLATLGPAALPKVGIAWRSMVQGKFRNSYYTDLSQWGEILRTPGVVFVNLQYGECGEELEQARKLFGVDIHQAPGLNLKDQLDDAAALTRALDLAIAPNTSVFAMAGAVGVPTWLLNLDCDWTMLGTDRVPWLPSVKVYRKPWGEAWEPLLAQVAGDLGEMTQRGGA